MASTIYEFFGYRPEDGSLQANEAAAVYNCPILKSTCEKRLSDGKIAGVCSLKPIKSGPVICCPIRLYADDYKILTDVVSQAFGEDFPLLPGREALAKVKATGKPSIAVFGKKWGGELRLPKRSGSGGYFVDWVLAKLNGSGELEEFVAVEVQTIDTTGNYRNGINALENNRLQEKTTAGLNWENVSKRILPQLIYKGQLLQREEFCKKGLFFVCPEPVYTRIMERLGGESGLVKYALQPASISFLAYNFDFSTSTEHGQLIPLKLSGVHSTTVYKVQEAFNNVSLEAESVYKDAIIKALYS
ncbi:NotI family restriction endonuclease [Flavobacterium caeni]|uniref:Restriction endonuclease NotI n=1 Tax=Flavobacterium caeni TaxID=490189 RepID=A0A1G5KM06_9FLAO|nr:NotI family restriction endonuclease [Flavobacterium caeni]SCZ00979.1 Restriction endonuclease NotI [Flavobacterium caeni]